MTPLHDQSHFEASYEGLAPWDIGKPQPDFVNVADTVQGDILDSGCGTGENALFFAARGHHVTGIDFVEAPIRMAQQKATERGLSATFLVMDALSLADLPRVFDSVLDSGLFHVFDDPSRERYVAGLASVLKPGGRLYLACFSDQEPGTQGPRRVSLAELHQAFAQDFAIDSITPTRFEVRPDLKDMAFSPGGPKAWFAVIARK